MLRGARETCYGRARLRGGGRPRDRDALLPRGGRRPEAARRAREEGRVLRGRRSSPRARRDDPARSATSSRSTRATSATSRRVAVPWRAASASRASTSSPCRRPTRPSRFSRPEEAAPTPSSGTANLLERAGRIERAIEVLRGIAAARARAPRLQSRIEELRKEASVARRDGSATQQAVRSAFGDDARYELREQIGRGGMGVVVRGARSATRPRGRAEASAGEPEGPPAGGGAIPARGAQRLPRSTTPTS